MRATAGAHCRSRPLWARALGEWRGLALTLLLLAAMALLVGALVPQRHHLSAAGYQAWRQRHLLAGPLEALGLNEVFSAWWAFLLAALLAVGLARSTLARAQRLWRAGVLVPKVPAAKALRRFPNYAQIDFPGPAAEGVEAAAELLRRRGYRVARPSPGALYAEKGRVGRWGSVLFHLSLVLLLFGGLYSWAGRFSGVMVLAEGQAVSEDASGYLALTRIPLLGEQYQRFQVRLDRFRPTFAPDGTGVDYLAELTALEYGQVVAKGTARPGQPFTYRGTSFVLEKYGLAPLFTLRDERGKELFSAYVNLVILNEGARDHFQIPGTGLRVEVWKEKMAPSAGREVEAPALLGPSPTLHVVVRDGQAKLYDGPLALRQEAALGRLRLSWDDLRYWSRYEAVRDPGQPLVFGSLWLLVLGAAARYLFVGQRVWVRVAKKGPVAVLAMAGMAKRFPTLYADEFRRLAADMEAFLAQEALGRWRAPAKPRLKGAALELR